MWPEETKLQTSQSQFHRLVNLPLLSQAHNHAVISSLIKKEKRVMYQSQRVAYEPCSPVVIYVFCGEREWEREDWGLGWGARGVSWEDTHGKSSSWFLSSLFSWKPLMWWKLQVRRQKIIQGFGVSSSGWRFWRLGLASRGDEGRVREGRVRGNLVYHNVVMTSTHCFLSRFFDGTLKKACLVA